MKPYAICMLPWKLQWWAWLLTTTDTNCINILGYIIKCRTEDDISSLSNLLYKFNWLCHARNYLEEPAVFCSILLHCKYWIVSRHYTCMQHQQVSYLVSSWSFGIFRWWVILQSISDWFAQCSSVLPWHKKLRTQRC